jgi:O-antigen/teichoic acid export membrane protein
MWSQRSFKQRAAMPGWTGQWLRDTRLLLSSQFLTLLATTVIAIVLARSLGPSDWGLFSALLGLSLGLATFVDLGLGTWLLRDLSRLREEEPNAELRDHESSRRVIGGISANLLFGTLLLLIAGSVVALLREELATALTLVGLIAYTILVAASNCLEAFLRANRNVKRVAVAMLLERFLLLGLVVAIAVIGIGIWSIGIAYLLAGFARVAFVGKTVFIDGRLPIVVPKAHHVRRYVASGVPFAFSTVALNVIPRFDTLVVAIVSATSAGYFALGDRIVGPALIAPAVASTALYPFLAREGRGSKAAWKISAVMMILGFTAAGAGLFLAPIVVPLLFGSSYEPAVPVVQTMLFVIPFSSASSPLLARLYTSGKERRVFVVTFSASALGTLVIVVGQLTIGASGAAAGYVLRQVLFTVALCMIGLKLHREISRARGLEHDSGAVVGDLVEPN